MSNTKRVTVDAVRCQTCGTLHAAEADTFVSVHGNICRGLSGGVVGNNLDKEGKIERVSIYCYPSCFAEVLGIMMAANRDDTHKSCSQPDTGNLMNKAWTELSEQRRCDFDIEWKRSDALPHVKSTAPELGATCPWCGAAKSLSQVVCKKCAEELPLGVLTEVSEAGRGLSKDSFEYRAAVEEIRKRVAAIRRHPISPDDALDHVCPWCNGYKSLEWPTLCNKCEDLSLKCEDSVGLSILREIDQAVATNRPNVKAINEAIKEIRKRADANAAKSTSLLVSSDAALDRVCPWCNGFRESWHVLCRKCDDDLDLNSRREIDRAVAKHKPDVKAVHEAIKEIWKRKEWSGLDKVPHTPADKCVELRESVKNPLPDFPQGKCIECGKDITAGLMCKECWDNPRVDKNALIGKPVEVAI